MTTQNPEIIVTCPDCQKIPELCLCSHVSKLKTRRHVLILQHPQEPDKELGTARLANLSLENSSLVVGLSWANLKKVLAKAEYPKAESANSNEWAVLYLGSGLKELGRGNRGATLVTSDGPKKAELVLVDKNGNPLPESAAITKALKGIVIIDGTWSQAKALWWRNPWLLKLRRAILIPSGPSLYGQLRSEPRKECLSTLEAITESLEALGDNPEAKKQLTALFRRLLQKYRDLKAGKKAKTPVKKVKAKSNAASSV